MKMRRLTYIAAIAFAFGALAGLPSVAHALTFGDTRDLGSIVPPEPADPVDEEHYVNSLITNGSHTETYKNNLYTYIRTAASCGTCPAAVFNSKSGANPPAINGVVQVDLGSGGFTYLLGKYDGPNGGDEVWNVQGLTGIVTIPAFGFGRNNSQYGLSHWTLFGPGGAVPDGGATVMLLGAALGALGMARRFLRS
jgi:VPDSG-CTERM motif